MSDSGGCSQEECQDMIRTSLRTPMVRFLREQMEKAGCGVGDNFFKAVKCDQKVSGGYVTGEGIAVCSNAMNYQDDVDQVVIHELIHPFDECRAANLDWRNCAHHACSEIRAGHLSGDCNFKRELLRGYMKMRGHEQVGMCEKKGYEIDEWKPMLGISFSGCHGSFLGCMLQATTIHSRLVLINF